MTPRAAAAVLIFLVAALAALLPTVAHATPGRDACTGMLHRQAGTPDTILVTTPGTWCLDQDLLEDVDVPGSSFTMILIDADDVSIDCRGHRIEYSGTALGMYGIATFPYRLHVTVRNCQLRGFDTAIDVDTWDDVLIEDNVVRDSRGGDAIAISAFGRGTIRRNRIYGSIGRAIVSGYDSLIADNLIDGVTNTEATPAITAIDLLDADAAEVRGNTIRGLHQAVASPGDAQAAIHVAFGDGGRVRFIDNVLVGEGAVGSIAFACEGDNPSTFTDNVVDAFETTAANCVDGGDNDVAP